MPVCTCICMYITYIRSHACIYNPTRRQYICVCMSLYLLVSYIFVYICLYVCIYVCMHMYVSVSLLHAIITPHLIIFVWSHSGSVGHWHTDSYDLGDKCSNSNFVKCILFQLYSPFALKNYPPVTSRRTGFLVEAWTASKICIQAHTCKYIHIQLDTYQYMQMHAHTCNTSRYRWIHTYTYIYIHMQLLVDANTDTYIYKQYQHIQTDMSRYIHFAHTYTYRWYIHIYTHTCRYKIWTTYDFWGKFIYACILFVYMSLIHAYMKPRFDMNTYELARSLMMYVLRLCSHRGASPCTLHAHYAHYAHF